VVLKPKSGLRLENIRAKALTMFSQPLFEVFPILEKGFLIIKGVQ